MTLIVCLTFLILGGIVGALVHGIIVDRFWDKQKLLADAYDETAKNLLKRACWSAQGGNLHTVKDEFALAEECQARAREIRKAASGNGQ